MIKRTYFLSSNVIRKTTSRIEFSNHMLVDYRSLRANSGNVLKEYVEAVLSCRSDSDDLQVSLTSFNRV